MINSRFKIADWVKKHNYSDSHYTLQNLEGLAKLSQGLARFKPSREKPLVSIVVPVWNEEKNIMRTLSTFAQMEIPYSTELIFVNNNSTDGTARILKRLGVQMINEPRQGIAHARLTGLRASRGTYQLCGDGDSLYPPTWISAMVDPMINDSSVTCVYGKYSFVPAGYISRISLGLYELVAERLFEYRRLKREFLNVRGSNFGFRVAQGLEVKGFEMPVARVFDNDENSENYVVFSEDGRMSRKLGEIGKLKLVRTYEARIWTSSRRLLRDGTLTKAFTKRIRKEWKRLFEYTFGPSKLKFTTDSIQPQA